MRKEEERFIHWEWTFEKVKRKSSSLFRTANVEDEKIQRKTRCFSSFFLRKENPFSNENKEILFHFHKIKTGFCHFFLFNLDKQNNIGEEKENAGF